MKTPEERGPFPTWVVEVRNALDLTSEQVAGATGYDDATIRKLEGGQVTRPQRRKVTEYLQRVAREKGMRIPPPPGEAVQEQTSAQDLNPASVEAIHALTAAAEATAAAMQEIVAEMRLARAEDQARSEGLAVALGDLASTLERLRLAPIAKPEK